MNPNQNFNQNQQTSPIVPPPVYAPAKMPTNKSPKTIYWVVAIIIVLAGLYYFVIQKNSSGTSMSTAKFSSENVQVSNVDFANMTGTAKLPAGFPTDIPVELANITNSSTQYYPDKKTTLYSVSYTSAHQAEDLYQSYGAYLKKDNYAVGPTTDTATQLTYLAISPKGSLYIVIVPQSGGAKVQVSYSVKSS
jgi:hypothetical protein